MKGLRFIAPIFIAVLLVTSVPAHAQVIEQVTVPQASESPLQNSSLNSWLPVIEMQTTGSFDTVCLVIGAALDEPFTINVYQLDDFPTFTAGTFHLAHGTSTHDTYNSSFETWEYECAVLDTPLAFVPGDVFALGGIGGNVWNSVILSGNQPSPQSYIRTSNSGYLNSASNFSSVSETASYNFSIPFVISLGIPGSDTLITEIETVTPVDDPDGSMALATSTTFAFGATGYVIEDDFKEGMYLKISYLNNVAAGSLAVGPAFSDAGGALCSWLPSWMCPGAYDDYEMSGSSQGSFTFEIEEPGEFDFSTTTDMQIIGRHTLTSAIWKTGPSAFGISIGDSVFYATTTSFTVATSSSYDRATGQTVETILLQNAASSSPPVCFFDIGTPANYFSDIAECILALGTVATDTVASSMQMYMGDLLSRAPWGYATRVFVILTNDTATSTLPSLAVSIPSGLPMSGSSFDFSPWEPIESAVTLIDETEVETIDGSPLDQFEFWWNVMWSLIFAFWLMREFYNAYELGDFEDLESIQSRGRAGGRDRYALGAYSKLNNARRSFDRNKLNRTADSIANHRQRSIDRYNSKHG